MNVFAFVRFGRGFEKRQSHFYRIHGLDYILKEMNSVYAFKGFETVLALRDVAAAVIKE